MASAGIAARAMMGGIIGLVSSTALTLLLLPMLYRRFVK
jgi:Cu/Ag efflux pump CusA